VICGLWLVLKLRNLFLGEKTFVRRYQTPERIELENIRLSMIHFPEDIPEEKLAKHNFSGSFSQDDLDSPEEYMR